MALGRVSKRHPHSLRMDLGIFALCLAGYHSSLGRFSAGRRSPPAKFCPLRPLLGLLPARKSRARRRTSILAVVVLFPDEFFAATTNSRYCHGPLPGDSRLHPVDRSQRHPVSPLHPNPLEPTLRTMDGQQSDLRSPLSPTQSHHALRRDPSVFPVR